MTDTPEAARVTDEQIAALAGSAMLHHRLLDILPVDEADAVMKAVRIAAAGRKLDAELQHSMSLITELTPRAERAESAIARALPAEIEEVVERLDEKIIGPALTAGHIVSGLLAERLINERHDAAATIRRLAAPSDRKRTVAALKIARQFTAGTDDGDREYILNIIDAALAAPVPAPMPLQDEERAMWEREAIEANEYAVRLRAALVAISERGPKDDPCPNPYDPDGYLSQERNVDEAFSRGSDRGAYFSAKIARDALNIPPVTLSAASMPEGMETLIARLEESAGESLYWISRMKVERGEAAALIRRLSASLAAVRATALEDAARKVSEAADAANGQREKHMRLGDEVAADIAAAERDTLDDAAETIRALATAPAASIRGADHE